MLEAISPARPPETYSDAYLIKEIKNGNGDAFIALSERYDYIISYNIARLRSSSGNSRGSAYMRADADGEDLFQECRIILYKAAKYYDFMKNVKFSTYANACVKNYLISFRRKYGKNEKYSGYDFVPLDEIRENESARYDSYFSFGDFSSFVNLNILTALEKKVFAMYAENRSYKYMAHMLDKSVKSIDNAVCRIKSKLKPYAEYFVSEY